MMLPETLEGFRKLRPSWVRHKDTGGYHAVLRIRGPKEECVSLKGYDYDVKIEHDSLVYDEGYYVYEELREHYRLA